MCVQQQPLLGPGSFFYCWPKIIEPQGEDNFVGSNKPADLWVPLTRSEAEACAALPKAG